MDFCQLFCHLISTFAIYLAYCCTYSIAILLVHHLRKMTDKDPVNKLSGTTGLSGAADTLFILGKSTRL